MAAGKPAAHSSAAGPGIRIEIGASGLRVDGTVHAVRIKAAGMITAGVDNVENLRRSARDAQRVAVDVVGNFRSGRDVQLIHGWAVHAVSDAGPANRAGVLGL